ncbi:MAG: diaminopimelate epimerase [Candidatus Omnitrophota bacterium]|nr:MAG: diaminopimelate epimerase [Candidatus Omnitrophota bacterium]
MKIDFTKVVASGNDFIIVDNRENKLKGKVSDFGDFARFSSRRKYSVGADGLLVLEDSEKADFKMRIFNPDGSEVTMCGNGVRCSVLYAYQNKWCGSAVKIETGAGILEAEIKDKVVRIKMTPPTGIKLEQNIGIGKTIINIHAVNTGVPHAIHFVENIENYPVKEIGEKIRYHRLFEPEGTNADFVKPIDKSTISLRTYERGVEDETHSCGTGVVASAIISHLVNDVEQPVNAITRSKDVLKVYFRKEHNRFHDVYLEGGARIVFEGGINYV